METGEILKYKTITTAATGDFRDRGSKFLAYAYPVKNVSNIKEQVNSLKKEHPKAVHYCYAYRLGTDGLQYRANDDGEPAGSAGKPILGQIDSLGLTDTLVIVVRYFGGTLLGIPGLINAYKTATALALQKCVVIEKWIEEIVDIEFEYQGMGEVLYLLKHCEATIYQQDLQLFCKIRAGIPLYLLKKNIELLSEIKGVKVEVVGVEK